MSPIGRVFIVLNLALAGGFLVVSGTHLQQQHNFKTKFENEQKERQKQVDALTQEGEAYRKQRDELAVAKSSLETEVSKLTKENSDMRGALKVEKDKLAAIDASLQAMTRSAAEASSEIKAAFEQAANAYKMAVEDQKTRDEAVRTKDAAVAENRDLKNEIARLNDTVTARDGEIAGLKTDRSQLQLLVKVAETNGFLRSMAAPNLAGLVTTANGRLCTIQITDNPGKIDIKESIEQGKWGFAIYDASGYKGEAIAERYEESANAVLCKVFPVKGEIREGDKAATKMP